MAKLLGAFPISGFSTNPFTLQRPFSLSVLGSIIPYLDVSFSGTRMTATAEACVSS